MTEMKFDSLIINGQASSVIDPQDIFNAYVESKKQFGRLPVGLIKDDRLVQLNLFKEVYFQKNSQLLFRKSETSNDALVNYWLSKVKRLAYLYSSFNELPEFDGITKDELLDISSNNYDPMSIKKIENALAMKGIIFVIEPSILGIKLDGVVFKLDNGRPVIAMSLRYKRLDYFWFTLMHELSHICLHYEKIDGYIVDDLESQDSDTIELEANKLSLDLLIPKNIWRTCGARKDHKETSVIEFSKKYNIHPSIVAGRIQRELNNYKKLAALVNKIDTREILLNE